MTASQDQPVNGANIFFVATNGNDGWSGTLPAPDRTKSDGPFSTIRTALARTSPAATIFVRNGSYFWNTPIVLGPEHSGLTLASYENEKPVVSGGRPITGWKEVTIDGKPLWSAEVPGAREGDRFFHELWVNGRRATRARHPSHGYLAVEKVPDATPDWQQGQTRFQFKESDFKNWSGLTNAEVVVMSRWVESRLPIQAVDAATQIFTFSKKSVFQLAAGDPYYIEHALEALDEPGEWYLDRNAGMLYYWPRPNERIATIEAIAPSLSQILSLDSVTNVTIKGLTFSHNEWYFPDGFATRKDTPAVSPAPQAAVGGFAQAAIGVPAAVTVIGARNCRFDHCTFAHIGSYGLELGRGCQSNLVTHCDLFDLAGGGLKIGETAIREKSEDLTRGNEVSDCQIFEGGRVFHSAIGIWIGQSPANRISHNLIHDFYYTGISIGWTWGYGPSAATNNLVEFNHVHHVGVESDGDGPTLSDMGGIYTLGRQTGTRIVNNLWHDIAGRSYGGWGIYLDEGSSGIVVESNLVYRTTHGGFHQHYGETNILRNNIFAFARDHQLQRTRPEPHSSFTFETNIVYFDTGVLLGGDWSSDQYVMDRNLYWDTRSKTNSITFAGVSVEKWRERGHDQHSLIADPLFVAPKSDDFVLQPGSPASKIGFQPLEFRSTGPRR